jgi:hypothetical protein
MNRRSALLAGLAIVPLTRCTYTTTGGVTTATLNTAEVAAWGQAIVNAAGLLLAIPGVSALTAPYSSVVSAALTAASSDLTAFATASGGAVTVTFNGTSAGAAVSSLLADGQSLYSTFQTALGSQLGSLGATVGTYVSALQTVVSLLSAAVTTAQGLAAATIAPLPMTEAQALNVLHVKTSIP